MPNGEGNEPPQQPNDQNEEQMAAAAVGPEANEYSFWIRLLRDLNEDIRDLMRIMNVNGICQEHRRYDRIFNDEIYLPIMREFHEAFTNELNPSVTPEEYQIITTEIMNVLPRLIRRLMWVMAQDLQRLFQPTADDNDVNNNNDDIEDNRGERPRAAEVQVEEPNENEDDAVLEEGRAEGRGRLDEARRIEGQGREESEDEPPELEELPAVEQAEQETSAESSPLSSSSSDSAPSRLAIDLTLEKNVKSTSDVEQPDSSGATVESLKKTEGFRSTDASGTAGSKHEDVQPGTSGHIAQGETAESSGGETITVRKRRFSIQELSMEAERSKKGIKNGPLAKHSRHSYEEKRVRPKEGTTEKATLSVERLRQVSKESSSDSGSWTE